MSIFLAVALKIPRPGLAVWPASQTSLRLAHVSKNAEQSADTKDYFMWPTTFTFRELKAKSLAPTPSLRSVRLAQRKKNRLKDNRRF